MKNTRSPTVIGVRKSQTLGIALRNLNKYEEAIISYDKALSINPNDCLALNNKGKISFIFRLGTSLNWTLLRCCFRLC